MKSPDNLEELAVKTVSGMYYQHTPFNYFEYPGMFHDWVIIISLKESQDVISKVKGLVR